ncbi:MULTISPECIES: hypothetical protein [unclassified Streptomyces]|uniref:hypothetical protein n=1 Tax=unclassified Streptomyces TaxID=2593676 RepID=UPI001160EE97|nr:hypothetical protein [Streptomyces sp. TSRI0107]
MDTDDRLQALNFGLSEEILAADNSYVTSFGYDTGEPGGEREWAERSRDYFSCDDSASQIAPSP